MWIQCSFVVLCLVSGALGDCDNEISVEGVSTSNGNDIVNGLYRKLHDGGSGGCNSRDVFNHTENNVYLYHIEQGSLTGFWMFRDTLDCGNVNENDGRVRNNDGEFNPGLIQTGWQENQGGNWELRNDIDVDCYSKCRYQLRGAANTSLNGYYEEYQSGNYECNLRNVYKLENLNLYLFFEWADYASPEEYYWLIHDTPCADAVNNGAYLQVDDYAAAPHYIFNDWQERQSDGSYLENTAVDIDCYGGDPGTDLSPGAIAGIVIGCLAGVAIIGGIIWFCCFRDRD